MMKKAAASLALSLLALPLVTTPANALPNKDRMVIVISLDGFPAYALQDPRLPIPTLRKLAKEGASARTMLPINPTVTWPNHTAMVTGVDASQHHVLVNGLITHLDDGTIKIEPWRDKDIMVHAPTVYDAAFNAGLTTAQVDWVAIYNAKTINWTFAEEPNPNGQIEGELIADGKVTQEQLAKFNNSSSAWQDEIRTAAAIDILKRHKPNLLLIHYLSLDSLNHEYGPMTDASLQTMAYLDDRVKEILDTIHSEHLDDKATVLIVSDHGFRKTQHVIHADIAIRQAGLMHQQNGKQTWDAFVVAEGGTAMVYIKDPGRRAELTPKLKLLLANIEGVNAVYTPDDFARLGLPLPTQTDQAPDLVLAAKPGYGFAGGVSGNLIEDSNRGVHGYLNTDPSMNAIFMAYGTGIRPGTQLDAITNLDVAPTIAALLGLDFKNTTGHPLTDILTK